MQVVSLEPEIRWMPQWSVDKQVTMSGGEVNETQINNTGHTRVFISRSGLLFTEVLCVLVCVFTHVSDVLSHSLALHQGGDPEAVVPVSTAEEQLAVVGDHKQSRCYLHTGGKGSGEEALGPG